MFPHGNNPNHYYILQAIKNWRQELHSSEAGIKAQLEAAYLRDLVLSHSILQYTVNYESTWSTGGYFGLPVHVRINNYVLTSRYEGLGMKVGRKEKSPRPNNVRCWLHDVTMML